MNIHLQIREHIATFKALTGNSPAYLTKLFIRCSNETYSLRSNYNELQGRIQTGLTGLYKPVGFCTKKKIYNAFLIFNFIEH